MSDVDTLRRAAAVMRERSNAATPGPWEVVRDQHRGYPNPSVEVSIWAPESGRYVTEDVSMVESSIAQWQANAEHIASWPPAVALAVADLLDREAVVIARERARLVASFGEDKADDFLQGSNAVAVARAYLGGA